MIDGRLLRLGVSDLRSQASQLDCQRDCLFKLVLLLLEGPCT